MMTDLLSAAGLKRHYAAVHKRLTSGPVKPALPKKQEPDEYRFSDPVHSVDIVVHAAAKHFGFLVSELLSTHRVAPLVYARHVAMYVAKAATIYSLTVIGRRMSGRDHTTIGHGVGKIAAAIERNDLQTIADVEAVDNAAKEIRARSSGILRWPFLPNPDVAE